MRRLKEKVLRDGSLEQRKFEVIGEIGFWVRADNRRKAEESAQNVIDKFLDKRLYQDEVLHNPWVEVKNIVEVKD